jgi:hypothetical protein
MILYKLNTYRHVIAPVIKSWCDAKGGDPKSHIPELALSTSCPIVVVGYLVGELYGFTQELDNYLRRLERFYKCEVISE